MLATRSSGEPSDLRFATARFLTTVGNTMGTAAELGPVFSPDATTTVSTAAASYLAFLDLQVALGRAAPATRRNTAFGLRFLGALGEVRLGDLRRSQVLAWLDAVAALPGERKTLCRSRDRVALSALKSVLSWCADRDACAPGLAARVRVQYSPEPGRSLSIDELDAVRVELARTEARLDDGPDGGSSARLLRVLAETGARIGAIRLAQRDWVSLERGVLVQPNGKTQRPVVVVLGRATDIIVRQLDSHASDWLFPSTRTSSGALSYTALVRLLQRIVRRAGVVGSITPHDFRHTFATLAHEAGCSIEEIASALSHSNTTTTRRFYLHSAVSPGARAVHEALGRQRRAA